MVVNINEQSISDVYDERVQKLESKWSVTRLVSSARRDDVFAVTVQLRKNDCTFTYSQDVLGSPDLSGFSCGCMPSPRALCHLDRFQAVSYPLFHQKRGHRGVTTGVCDRFAQERRMPQDVVCFLLLWRKFLTLNRSRPSSACYTCKHEYCRQPRNFTCLRDFRGSFAFVAHLPDTRLLFVRPFVVS